MRDITKLIIILILILSTAVIILMSVGSFGINSKAMKKSESVEFSKAVAEIFASTKTDEEFMELLEECWNVEKKESLIVSDDEKVCVVSIRTEKMDQGVMRYAEIEVCVSGKSTFILNTSKYVSAEKSQQ